VVPNFVKQALLGQPLTVYDDGLRTRSFCYYSDLVEGMVRLLLSDEVEPVNLGNPQEMSILDFARLIVSLSGSRSEIQFVKPKDMRTADDPNKRCPDISRARRVLGWEPVVPVEEGLRQTIEWFRGRLSA